MLSATWTVLTFVPYYIGRHVRWNLSITDTLGPDIFGHFLLQYRGFPLSEVKNVLVIPVGPKFLFLLWRFFLLSP